MKLRLSIVLILFASLAAAQSTDPKLSDASHARIRDIQLSLKTVENQYTQLQMQYNALSEQLKAATDTAYKEAGVKPEEWTLDLTTLKFTKAEKKAEAKK